MMMNWCIIEIKMQTMNQNVENETRNKTKQNKKSDKYFIQKLFQQKKE